MICQNWTLPLKLKNWKWSIKRNTFSVNCKILIYILLFFEGRNDKGQLGHGNLLRQDIPTLIEGLQDINVVDATCGKNHTLVLTGKCAIYRSGNIWRQIQKLANFRCLVWWKAPVQFKKKTWILWNAIFC